MVPIRAALAVLILQTAARAGDETLSSAEFRDVQRRFEDLQQKTRTFRAELVQTVGVPGMKKDVLSRGTLFYSRADSALRIDFVAPRRESVLLTRDAVTIRKNGKPAERKKAGDAKSAIMLRALLEFFAGGDPRMFPKREMQAVRSGDRLKVVIRPGEETGQPQLPQRIETVLAWPGLEVQSLRLEMRNGAIKYDFSGVRRDAPLPRDLLDL